MTHFMHNAYTDESAVYKSTVLTHIQYDGSFLTTWGWQEEGKEMFYLTTHSTHFIYGYMASDIWYATQIVREETHCCHMGYSF